MRAGAEERPRRTQGLDHQGMDRAQTPLLGRQHDGGLQGVEEKGRSAEQQGNNGVAKQQGSQQGRLVGGSKQQGSEAGLQHVGQRDKLKERKRDEQKGRGGVERRDSSQQGRQDGGKQPDRGAEGRQRRAEGQGSEAVKQQGGQWRTRRESKAMEPGGGEGQQQTGTAGQAGWRVIRRRVEPDKWMEKRPRVRLRMQGNAWLGLRDVMWTTVWQAERQRRGLEGREESRSWVSRAVARQLSWEVTEDMREVEVTVEVQGDEWQAMLAIHDDDEPSMALGEDAVRAMVVAGYKLQTEGWEHAMESVEPSVESGTVRYEEQEGEEQAGHRSGSDSDQEQQLRDADSSDGESEGGGREAGEGLGGEQQEEREFWEKLVVDHQGRAVAGEEPGGLVSGGEWDAPLEVTRVVRNWEKEWQRRQGEELQAGPEFTGPESNPKEFEGRAEKYKAGRIHAVPEEWWKIEPRCDSEVLRWIESNITVRLPESARGARMKNGKAARENPVALGKLMQKRLRNGTWRTAGIGKLVSLIQLNLQPKPSADIPWRLTVWPKDANEGLSKWSVRYEGVRKLGLVLTQGCWVIIIDLESGYDAMLLAEECKAWFGARFYASKELLEELQAEGLLVEGCVGPLDEHGGAEVFVEPNTLPQGFAWACAIFTKVVRQMAREWRARGMRLLHLIDDLLFAFETYALAIWGRDYILEYLQAKGWFVSWLKAVLTPHQVGKFLGFVFNTITMRLHLPANKVVKIEGLLDKVIVTQGKEETHRSLAVPVGNVVAADLAVPPARMHLRHTCRCIRPVGGDWEGQAEVTEKSLDEMKTIRKYLRLWNEVGGPIRRRMRMCEVRVMFDAATSGFGYRCDGREVRDVKWDGRSTAVAAEWEGEPHKHQVHREMAAAVQVTRREVEKLRGKDALYLTDAKAVETYINYGVGPSEELCEMAEGLYKFCCENDIRMRGEHMAGVSMVAAGVDSMSRAAEFAMAVGEYRKIHGARRWGRRNGFSGFTVDLCASQKTAKCKKYYSRGGEGAGSLGDLRTARLDPAEHYYVVPPVGMIETVLQILEEASVAAVLVLPMWIGREWSQWLRQRAEDMEAMPWRSYPAVWLDVAEKKPKRHVLASQWEFMVVAVDWRQGAQLREEALPAPKRWTDKQSKEEFEARLRAQWARDKKPGGHGYPRRGRRGGNRSWHRQQWPICKQPRRRKEVFVVLSLCGGMGTVAVALQRVFTIFGIDMKVVVKEAEIHEWARRIAKAVAGKTLQHVEPHDLWEWASSVETLKELVRQLGPVDGFVMGYSCQDVSTAFKTGKGLMGPKSSVFFVGKAIWEELRTQNTELAWVFECTWFEQKHPKDWKMVQKLLGVPAQCLEAAKVAPARRRRAFWANFEMLPLRRQEEVEGEGQRIVSAEVCLEEGRRPGYKWADKLPTIMSSGPRSWNMKRCVAERVGGRWQLGPPRITEAEVAMGWWRNATQYVEGDVVVPEAERWRAVGNAIQVGVMAHVWVSALVTKGYITRDDVRLKGQVWTVNQDGPAATGSLEEAVRRMVTAVAEATATKSVAPSMQMQEGGKKRERSSGKAVAVKRKRGGAVKAEVRSRWGSSTGCKKLKLVTMKDVYDRVDAKGVPQLQRMSREVGKMERRHGRTSSREEHKELLRQATLDGLVLSRSDKTWEAYAGWCGLFEEYGDLEGVEVWGDDLEQQAALMQLALADLFWHGQYAVRSLKLMFTAANSKLKDITGKTLRQYAELKAQLEGYERKEGLATRKKMPTLEEHVNSFMGVPRSPWQGLHGSLKWVQWVAIVCLAWSTFLRKQEIINMELCDLAWSTKGVTVTIKKTKNDTKSQTRSCEMVYDEEFGERCMTTYLHDYVVEMHGGVEPKEGCTRQFRPAERCRS